MAYFPECTVVCVFGAGILPTVAQHMDILVYTLFTEHFQDSVFHCIILNLNLVGHCSLQQNNKFYRFS